MTVLEQATPQNLVITPREGDITSLSVYDEQTRETTTYNSFTVSVGQYTTVLNGVFDFKEGNSYVLRALNNSNEVLCFFRAFCTSNDPQSQQQLTGQFTETTSNNDFVFYE